MNGERGHGDETDLGEVSLGDDSGLELLVVVGLDRFGADAHGVVRSGLDEFNGVGRRIGSSERGGEAKPLVHVENWNASRCQACGNRCAGFATVKNVFGWVLARIICQVVGNCLVIKLQIVLPGVKQLHDKLFIADFLGANQTGVFSVWAKINCQPGQFVNVQVNGLV